MVYINYWYEKQLWERVTYMFVEFVRFGQPFYRGLCVLIPNSPLLARWTYRRLLYGVFQTSVVGMIFAKSKFIFREF